MSSYNFNDPTQRWFITGNRLRSSNNTNLTLDASGISGSRLIFQAKSLTRTMIDDGSGNLDLSRNWLQNLSYLVPCQKPVIASSNDSSYNFSVFSVAYNSTARSSLIPSPYNGQFCFLLSTSTLEYFNNGA